MTHGLGRKPHPETPEAAAAYPVTAHPNYRVATNTVAYWWEGGAWLDQGQTGTCVGNAMAHRRADAPVPASGIDETYARQLYVDASGDTSLQEGTSALLACRVLKARGTISAYHWVTSASELRNTVLTIGSVCCGTDWFDSMFSPKVAYGSGRAYITVDPSSGLAGGHEYVINGINLAPAAGPPYYRLKNSWGRSWPGSPYGAGTARIACSDLEDLIFNRGGDCVLLSENP